MRLDTSALHNRDIHLIRLILIWAPLVALAVPWVWATIDFCIHWPPEATASAWDYFGFSGLCVGGLVALAGGVFVLICYGAVARRTLVAWRANTPIPGRDQNRGPR